MANAVNPLRKAKTTARDTRPISHGHPWPPIHYEPDSGINALRNSGRLATLTLPLGGAQTAAQDILGTTECTEYALKAPPAFTPARNPAWSTGSRLWIKDQISSSDQVRQYHVGRITMGRIGLEARPLHQNQSRPRPGNAAKERRDLENGHLQTKGPASLYPDPS
jgi:hypothetical protein